MYGRGNIMAIISKSWQSWFNNLSHSERSEESPPFAQRKGARGMHTSNPPSFRRKSALQPKKTDDRDASEPSKIAGDAYLVFIILVVIILIIVIASKLFCTRRCLGRRIVLRQMDDELGELARLRLYLDGSTMAPNYVHR